MVTLRPLSVTIRAMGVISLIFPGSAGAEGVLDVAKGTTVGPRIFPLAKTEVTAEISVDSEAAHGTGGCAGCTVSAERTFTFDVMRALGAALAFFVVLARRRKKEKHA